MKRGVSGFSLIELIIALAIVASVIAAASTFFIGVVRQYKVQTKITESNVEGILGLELLRQDVESLGFGLPWNGSFNYTERATGASAALDALNDAPSNAPRAIVSIDCSALGINNGSDYIVIKSTRVGMSDAAGKWTTLRAGPVTRTWGGVSNVEDLVAGDRVIVLSPGGATSASRVLLTPVGGATFDNASLSAYEPIDTFQTNIVYGIDNGTLQRPFNRAEYFIADNATYRRPQHCATNTGVLVKAVVAHDGDGTTPTLLPLLDCVADLQVVFGLDTNGNRQVDSWILTTSGKTADQIRTQLVEVHVNILVQQGRRDDSYRYPNPTVYVGSPAIGGGKDFDVSAHRNYRWKQYTIVVKPKNLAN
jgi:prepilin-type N-terminal cleavage/methylation domain-containing protein